MTITIELLPPNPPVGGFEERWGEGEVERFSGRIPRESSCRLDSTVGSCVSQMNRWADPHLTNITTSPEAPEGGKGGAYD